MITIEEAIGIIGYSRDTHKCYADTPNMCRGLVGSVKHHKKCISRYNQVLELLESMRSKGD